MATLLLLAFTVGFAWTLIREGSQQHGAIRSSRDSTSSLSSFILFTSFHFEMVPRSVHLLSPEITTSLGEPWPSPGANPSTAGFTHLEEIVEDRMNLVYDPGGFV